MKWYIYKITNADESIVYVGSTTKTLKDRWRCHLGHYKMCLDGRHRACSIYYSFKEYGIENFSISLISEHKISNRQKLNEFEQLVINDTDCVNRIPAYKTVSEMIQQKTNVSSEITVCKCGETYTRGHKARHEQTEHHLYGVASEEERKNIDIAREDADRARKEALKARRNAVIECECGGSYQKANKSYHVRKSKAHLQWLADHH
ncbi:unnamed protein product [Phytophthora lilii]|uniref:Unnamed protein product n=1 Tax=Phytophthora lilii TaxID=2077276 RepID=A0A9W6XBL5_9STRA|nr:unnamed protein product [Phytophthora lilii]